MVLNNNDRKLKKQNFCVSFRDTEKPKTILRYFFLIFFWGLIEYSNHAPKTQIFRNYYIYYKISLYKIYYIIIYYF